MEEALVPEEEQPYEVPGNWMWTRLENVSNYIQRGKSPKYVEISTAKVVSQKCVQWSGFDITPARNIDEESLKSYQEERFLRKNDLLWNSTGTGTIGRVALIENELDGKVVADSHVTVVRPNQRIISSQVLYKWLAGPVVQNKLNNAWSGSTNQVELNLTSVKKQIVPIPPKSEQKRIVDKVERLLSKIDEAKRLIEEAKETFELRRAAIIKIILDEGINNNSIPMGWRKIKIKDLFTIFGGGTPSKSNKGYWNGKIPWISAKDMKSTYISETQDHITELGLKNSSTKLANKGSIAMVVRSGILQRTLPVAFLQKECSVNQDIKVFDSGNELVNKYFMWYVKGNEKNLLNNYSKSGTTVNSIEFEKFRFHEFILPPLEIVKRKVEKIENTIGKEESINQFLHIDDSLELLKQSILSKAFRGELGTNDPTEESAIELLKEVLQEQVK
ncbi:restriction endonuclease subunit S [Heyndrickxia faecalis]|nr:restriction endonuclease subunit S [Weizmannia sp. CD-2023]MEC2224629.1 restriction endonuclease subunit S [Weizmannia sp. CD-2023]